METTPTRQHRLILDPFRSGLMRSAAFIQAPGPEGWRLEIDRAGEPVYVSEDRRFVVQALEMVDAEGRTWRHAFVIMPLPVDLDLALELSSDFLGDGVRAWRDEPKPPPGSRVAKVRFHHCIGGGDIAPPGPWKRPQRTTARRQRATPTPS